METFHNTSRTGMENVWDCVLIFQTWEYVSDLTYDGMVPDV